MFKFYLKTDFHLFFDHVDLFRETAVPAERDHPERHPVSECIDVPERGRHEAELGRHAVDAVQVLQVATL